MSLNDDEVLDRARSAGLTIEAAGNMLHVRGPRDRVTEWLPVLRERKQELLEMLRCRCARCGVDGKQLVNAYWGAQYCSPCCSQLVAQLEEGDSWPEVVWVEDEVPRA